MRRGQSEFYTLDDNRKMQCSTDFLIALSLYFDRKIVIEQPPWHAIVWCNRTYKKTFPKRLLIAMASEAILYLSKQQRGVYSQIVEYHLLGECRKIYRLNFKCIQTRLNQRERLKYSCQPKHTIVLTAVIVKQIPWVHSASERPAAVIRKAFDLYIDFENRII